MLQCYQHPQKTHNNLPIAFNTQSILNPPRWAVTKAWCGLTWVLSREGDSLLQLTVKDGEGFARMLVAQLSRRMRMPASLARCARSKPVIPAPDAVVPDLEMPFVSICLVCLSAQSSNSSVTLFVYPPCQSTQAATHPASTQTLLTPLK